MENYLNQLSNDFNLWRKNNLPPKWASSMGINKGKWLSLEPSIQQSLNDIVATSLGEVIMYVNWGSKVLMYVDYPINEIASDLQIELMNALQLETRIEVNKINFMTAKQYKIAIAIEYVIKETGAEQNVII